MNRIPSDIIKSVLMFYVNFTVDLYETRSNVPGICERFLAAGYNTFWKDPSKLIYNYRQHLCLFHENSKSCWWPTGPIDYGDNPSFDDIYLNCVIPRIEYLVLLLKEQIEFELSDNNQNPT